MSPRRIIALLNASAGTLQRQGEEQVQDQLATAFATRGVTLTIESVDPSELRRAAERALAAVKDGTFDGIVAGGGDGSLQSVASALVGTGVPFGVLPLGTLNHFAKDLGVPATLDEAAAIIAAGATRAIDTGSVNGRMFLNNSSIGFYPQMVKLRESTRRRSRAPKWLAMIWASLQVMRYLPLRRLSITADGDTKPFRSPFVFVGNNEYQLTGESRGSRVGLDDGLLCLYVTERQSRTALFGLVAKLALNRLDPERDLTMLRLHEVTVDTRRGRRVLVALDGEIETMRTPLNYRMQPKSLLVFAPATP